MTPNDSRILILGASGMLGNTLLRYFSTDNSCTVFGSARSATSVRNLPSSIRDRIVVGVDVENSDSLIQLFADTRPTVVINCIGLVKQRSNAENPLEAIPINSLLPHRLARLCGLAQARFIHVSTDCVFSGADGMYKETDFCDAKDLYGRSKLLGEVDYPHAITLRTSIIGHELNTSQGLIGWFLGQSGASVPGYTRAIFSGLPTVELARVIQRHILPRPELHGLYHVSIDPISKFDLLNLVAKEYEKNIAIEPSSEIRIDRSLDSSRFREATRYMPPEWSGLVRAMREFQ